MICQQCPRWNKGLPRKEEQHMGVCERLKKARAKTIYTRYDEVCRFGKSTLADMWLPEMEGYTIRQPVCCVCGGGGILNQHHVPPRSAGNLIIDGKKQEKPTITLCGSGNASGCHGKAHRGRLHFKYRGGRWWYLETEPIDRLAALSNDNWKECYECDW